MKDGAQKAVGQKISTPGESPEQQTEWNVHDSAATVVFVPDSKYYSRGTDFKIECAKKYGKPYCIIHYLDRGAIMGLNNMISQLGGAQSLNIAGPRESEHPGAYDLCAARTCRMTGSSSDISSVSPAEGFRPERSISPTRKRPREGVGFWQLRLVISGRRRIADLL
jgi:putative molybdenum carrier protein